MKGVIATRAPGVVVVDVTHDVPPQSVLAGALVLRAAAPYFPSGTVHVAVVDPGVGSDRRPICVETDRACFVGPDNGLFSLAVRPEDIRRAVVLADERFFLRSRSRTFHGRDVFAPVAATLANGTDVGSLGPPAGEVIRLTLPRPTATPRGVTGEVIYVDHFGNLVTNLEVSDVPAGSLIARLGGVRIGPVVEAYAAVEPGEGLAVLNSWDLVEIAVRDGSAAARYAAGIGTPVLIESV